MLFGLVKIVLVAYVLLCLLACCAQRKMVFPAGGRMEATPGDVGVRYEDVRRTVDGKMTHGWYMYADTPREGGGVILFCHGNAGNISNRLDSCEVFFDAGFDVLLFDYGGYGLSEGKASEKRCYADARAMWRYLTEDKGIAADRIILFGRSLGGGVALDLATEVQPRALILESTFLSAAKLGQESLPFLPVKLLLRYRFDNASKIGQVHVPLLMLHSREDEIVPFRHGEELFKLANDPKRFVEIVGSHNTRVMLFPGYIEEMQGFLEEVFREDSAAAKRSSD